VLEPGLVQTIELDHEALNALVTGDPEPKKRMFSQRDDVTLANPLGPPVRGFSEVDRVLDRVASGFRDGEPHRFERISEYATPDLAYVLEIERTRAKFGGAGEHAPFSLRATTIWRLEDGEWRIALRHADPITRARPLESIQEP
jgi:ketosteroid isomerase-like protein